MEIREQVKPRENYELYWRERKPVKKEPKKEEGVVRDMSQRIKELKAQGLQDRCKRQEIQRNRRAEISRLRSEGKPIKHRVELSKSLSEKDNIEMIEAIKLSEKVRARKTEKSVKVYSEKSKTRADAYAQRIEFMKNRDTLPTVFGLVTTVTYAAIKDISVTTVRRHILEDNINYIQMGGLFFVFAINFSDEEIKAIREKLKSYMPINQLIERMKIKKTGIYTVEGLKKYRAINIDGNLFFRMPD